MMSKTPEERAITRTKEFFAPHIAHWPDSWVPELKIYREFLLQEHISDFKNALFEELRIPQLVKRRFMELANIVGRKKGGL